MRKASSDYSFWMVDGKFVGVSLGYDYCAEHEWGIKELKDRFGIPESSSKRMGIKNRQITECIDSLVYKEETYKHQKFAILYTGYKYRTKEEAEIHIPNALEYYKEDILHSVEYLKTHVNLYSEPKDPMVTAWDGSSFGVGVMGETEIGYLKELYNAFLNKNAAITSINLNPGNPFSNGSLSLLIVDRLPQEALDNMYAADKKVYDRIDYEKKIGMTRIIEKYSLRGGKRGKKEFMACSPKWINYEDAIVREEIKKRDNTKYDIKYWVNYSDDDDNYGWYSVEEIKQWLTGSKKLSEIRKGNGRK